MRKGLMFGLLTILFITCGENDNKVDPGNNDKVLAVNDSYQVTEDTEFTISNFLSNDTFSATTVKIGVSRESVNKGSITRSGNNFVYKPAKSFVGSDSFTYTLCNQETPEKCSTATITITVADQGNPSAVNDRYNTIKNSGIIIDDFLQNDTLVDAAEIKSVDSSIATGTVVLNSDTTILYTPQTDFTGNDTFTYTVCDDDTPESCSTATVIISINEPSNFNIPAALQAYYNGVDFNLIGAQLKDELTTKISSTHTTFLNYTPGVWNALKKSDLDPTDTTKVVLIYGYNDTDGNRVTDRIRGINENGGNPGDWNREHVYPKSLGIPNLGIVGPGADAHSLRPCDATMNSNRSNKKFAAGSGNVGDSSEGWYPGDEWKGDVARMMMYMYLRYGNQCLPSNAAIGSAAPSDSNMIMLLLEWNAEDPVSDFEANRNNVIKDEQGNRNPFIDNPYLATIIWQGKIAENKWQ